jgi:hypothetical protein
MFDSEKFMVPVIHSYTDDFQHMLVLGDDFTRGGAEVR